MFTYNVPKCWMDTCTCIQLWQNNAIIICYQAEMKYHSWYHFMYFDIMFVLKICFPCKLWLLEILSVYRSQINKSHSKKSEKCKYIMVHIITWNKCSLKYQNEGCKKTVTIRQILVINICRDVTILYWIQLFDTLLTKNSSMLCFLSSHY